MATTTAQGRFGSNGTNPSRSRDAGGSVTDRETGAPAKASGGLRARLTSKKFLVAVALLLAVAGGAYKFLAPQPVVPPSGGDVVALDPTTLNLTGGHYLKIAISVQLVKGKASASDFATSKAAELTIDEFSDRDVASLSSNPARKKLTSDLLTKLKAAYPGEVFDVFLTQFVTQ